jgi:uncharacterized protein (TIGR02996 family)
MTEPNGPPTETTVIDELWRQVAASPDDLASRMVLADALADVDRDRGELIQLQCAAVHGWNYARAADRAVELVRDNWARWLGDLALVIDESTSRFERGMLDEVSVGLPTTPEDAWARARGHRELAVVRRVAARACSADRYVDFVMALPNQPQVLDVRDRADIAALARGRARWSARALYAWTSDLEGIDEWFPDLERLDVNTSVAQLRLLHIVPRLVRSLPKLHTIMVHSAHGIDGLLAIPTVVLA